MLYTVCFTQIMCSVDSLDPGHCPWTSIVEFLKIGQALFFCCSLHIYIYIFTLFAPGKNRCGQYYLEIVSKVNIHILLSHIFLAKKSKTFASVHKGVVLN